MSFKLPKSKVKVVPNMANADVFMGSKTHDGSFQFTDTAVYYSVYMREDGSPVNPFSSDEERGYLEEVLNKDLNPFVMDSDLFDVYVVIRKDQPGENWGLELDLSNPNDYLKYLILKTNPDVIEGYNKRLSDPSYRWIIVREGEEEVAKISAVHRKAVLYVLMTELSSREELYRVLAVVDSFYEKNASTEKLKARFADLIEDTARSARVYEALIGSHKNIDPTNKEEIEKVKERLYYISTIRYGLLFKYLRRHSDMNIVTKNGEELGSNELEAAKKLKETFPVLFEEINVKIKELAKYTL